MSYYNQNVYTTYSAKKPPTQPAPMLNMYRQTPNSTSNPYSNRISNPNQIQQSSNSQINRRPISSYSPAPAPGMRHRHSQKTNVYNYRPKSTVKTASTQPKYANRSQDPIQRNIFC